MTVQVLVRLSSICTGYGGVADYSPKVPAAHKIGVCIGAEA